jgi:hypothetical protein
MSPWPLDSFILPEGGRDCKRPPNGDNSHMCGAFQVGNPFSYLACKLRSMAVLGGKDSFHPGLGWGSKDSREMEGFPWGTARKGSAGTEAQASRSVEPAVARVRGGNSKQINGKGPDSKTRPTISLGGRQLRGEQETAGWRQGSEQ